MSEIIYPSTEKIIEYNLLAISLFKVKKADKAQVISKEGLGTIVEACKELDGDVYDKAVFLLKDLKTPPVCKRQPPNRVYSDKSVFNWESRNV